MTRFLGFIIGSLCVIAGIPIMLTSSTDRTMLIFGIGITILGAIIIGFSYWKKKV